jgi:hypothetical protein
MPPIPRTALGLELFQLMKEPSGVTPAAIREKPHLMGLRYVRAEAPALGEDNVQQVAVAVTAREFIDAATYALDKPVSQREHTDVDNVTAVRYLLALEQGAATMPLHERRKRAAECLRVEDAANLRHQYKTKTRGVTETRETRLMDAVADKLMERETQFLTDSQAAPSEPSNSPLLAGVAELYEVAGSLHSLIQSCLGTTPRPARGEEYPHGDDESALLRLGRFSQLVQIPPEEDRWDDWADPVLRTLLLLSPTRTVAALFTIAPFERDTIERMDQANFSAFGSALLDLVWGLIPQWRAWLQLCACDRTEPQADCAVHRFQTLLESYITRLDQCWRELCNPYESPNSYRFRTTPSHVIQTYSLNPAIDK